MKAMDRVSAALNARAKNCETLVLAGDRPQLPATAGRAVLAYRPWDLLLAMPVDNGAAELSRLAILSAKPRTPAPMRRVRNNRIRN